MTKSMQETNNGSFRLSTVHSQDGTRIGYRSVGHGPALIVVPGVLTTSEQFTTFARSLSDSLTVHILDRRGRGESGPQGPEYSMIKECEDIRAVQDATGATYIFGHSYGGLATLEAALTNLSFARIALYEPGVLIHSVPTDWNWIADYEQDLSRQDLRGAFATYVQGAGQSLLTRVPRWLARLILCLTVRGERWSLIARLLHENLNEQRELRRLASKYRQYEAIDADVLLMAGGKSPEFVHQMIHELNHTIQRSQAMTLPKLNHLSPENGHKPIQVAELVRAFFLENGQLN
ncbi:alpha/beta hydrolase [Paenibacillus sp. PR3]|uniref:Alpha/beta hydrolase n=1 Tax=Paenibacillus terricola TaxID=2763503 RepID=A0ABR8N2C7_9BACL|nr:alpha/beta hydrolase [Paenibacillus terricola]MBD3922030.1 alpha/beta hydrolase [Paenibacillus terricola]